MVKRKINILKVRQLMAVQNVTADKLAELMKVTPRTVKKLLSEAGSSAYTLRAVFKVARALKVDATKILLCENLSSAHC